MTAVHIVLFDDFETLDAMGPAEAIGRMPERYAIQCVSLDGGIVTSRQGIRVDTFPFALVNTSGILLIPGGWGTRSLVNDGAFVARLREMAARAASVLTVCTGSALLAKTGLLDGRSATTNKIAFDWVASMGPRVEWRKKARWVVDGKYYTSSGVSAGIDMALAFLRDRHGETAARECAQGMEYLWHDEADDDPFAVK